jgi:hypothetical protein
MTPSRAAAVARCLLEWVISIPTIGQFRCGVSTDHQLVAGGAFVTWDSVGITGLRPATTWRDRPLSRDRIGCVADDTDQSDTTPPAIVAAFDLIPAAPNGARLGVCWEGRTAR